MKTYNLGNIEIMTHDYYLYDKYKDTLHLTAPDLTNTRHSHLTSLFSDGWRFPTVAESSYMLDLCMGMNIGLFHIGYYFIDQGDYYSNNQIGLTSKRIMFMDSLHVYPLSLDFTTKGYLRLVRSI